VPFFEVHGDHDSRVYPFLAAFTHRYLDHLGVAPEKNRLAIVPGGGHVPWGDSVKRLLRPPILAFLSEVMPEKPGTQCG
jgi:pimeloyl-ACP methyl ester carboxylesterase